MSIPERPKALLDGGVSAKEFFSRWKQGVKDITPAQMNKINLQGNVMVLVGVLIGLWVTFQSKTWWLFVILCGSLFITGTGLLGAIQKQIMLKEFEKAMKGGYTNE